MITQHEVEQLTAYFAAEDHEFLRGFTYITEAAITDRLDSVDPSWTFQIVHVGQRDKQVFVTARLTVLDVSRENTGMATIIENSPGEPEKSATTDALKRCARLFGIGRYLLSLPNDVKDAPSLSKWLAGSGIAKASPKPHSDAPSASGGQSTKEDDEFTTDINKIVLAKGWGIFNKLADMEYDNPKHRENSVAKLVREGKIDPNKNSIAEALSVVRVHVGGAH